MPTHTPTPKPLARLVPGLPRSLQGRLLVGLLGTVVAVWLAAAAATWLDMRHELDELLDSHLAQAAALLVVQTASDISDDSPRPDAPQLHRYGPKVAFQVWHGDQLAMRSANAPEVPMVAAAALASAARREHHDDNGDDHDDKDQRHDGGRTGGERPPGPAGVGLGFHAARFNGANWRVFVAQGAEQDVRVHVGEQLKSRDDILLAMVRGMLWPMALALPLLALAVWWAVRRGTAPLRALGRSLAERDPGALAPVQVPDAPAEMQPMVDALNRLFERITSMVVAERRFTADAAHELRTPIAAIRTQAQVALAEPDAAERAHALRATLAGCDRATRLVEQLLTLSRLEAGAEPPAALLDLGALAQRVVAELAPRAIAQGQTLGLDAQPGCQLRGNDTLLAVLLRNLVDNALRYSPAGAELRVAVSQAGGQVLLQVDDSGPGLSDAELARLGERFFRVLGTGQDGSGLGWSIVRRIAAAQGASVQVARSATLGGLAVTVQWPAA
jgi:two-component system, OmpR family, sensor histidine kinase QseC